MTKYVYICSHGHSGSTLLDHVLGSHSRVESLGEISFLAQDIALNLKCSCGTPIRECEVWREVVARLSARLGVDLIQNPYALHLGYHQAHVTIDKNFQTPLYLLRRELILGTYYLQLRLGLKVFSPFLEGMRESIRNNFLVFDIVRDVLKADAVVDSSKSYLKAVGLYLHKPEDVRILLLTRDGRGVLYSNMKRDRPRDESVTSWLNQYDRALPLFRKHIRPEHVLQVKYEDFTMKPAEEMKRICAFLGLAYEPSMLDFTAVPHHSTDGNDIRFLRSSEIRVDTKWKEKLSQSDLDYFEKRAGRLNRELGYT